MLYNDRKLAKWQGFMLPEHGNELHQHRKNKKEVLKREQQSMDLIMNILSMSFHHKKKISIQMNELNNGNLAKDKVGIVIGFTDEAIVMITDEKQSRLNAENIRNIEVLEHRKLYHD